MRFGCSSQLPRPRRASRLCGEEGIDPKQAARAVKDADANRRDYLKRFYDVAEERPTDYDVVFNTDVLSPEQTADLVSRAASGSLPRLLSRREVGSLSSFAHPRAPCQLGRAEGGRAGRT